MLGYLLDTEDDSAISVECTFGPEFGFRQGEPSSIGFFSVSGISGWIGEKIAEKSLLNVESSTLPEAPQPVQDKQSC
jgi:hypothetical protein